MYGAFTKEQLNDIRELLSMHYDEKIRAILISELNKRFEDKLESWIRAEVKKQISDRLKILLDAV